MEVFYHYYLFYIVIQKNATYLFFYFFETYTKEKLYMYMYIFNVIFS